MSRITRSLLVSMLCWIVFSHSAAAQSPRIRPSTIPANAVEIAPASITWAMVDGWGSRRTPILEFDQIYGNHWDWTAGSGSSADAFDFANVATHGIGNAVGLDHPGNSCTEETMYAYVDFGETKKRDLNAGDILGVQALY